MTRLYDAFMASVERAGLTDWRTALLADARGVTLELGPGTGTNLARYPDAVERLLLLEPEPHMRSLLAPKLASARCPAELLAGPAEAIPLPDHSVDTVVSTLVLCSVADPARVLAEVRRVLRPGGQLLFLEHVRHHDAGLARWQRRLTPWWSIVAGNCHLDRDTEASLVQAGFALDPIHHAGLPKAPAVVRPTIRGAARPHNR